MTREELRAALGLTEGDTLTSVFAAPPPAEQVAHGKAPGAAMALAALLAGSPTWEGLAAGDDVPTVLRSNTDAKVVLVEADGVVGIRGGGLEHLDGLALDGRAYAAALAVHEGSLFIVEVDEGYVEILRVERGAPGLPDTTVPPLPAPPDVAALVGDARGSDAVLERVRELESSAHPFDRLAAVGTLARLWRWTDRGQRAEALAGQRIGPAGRLGAWAKALGDAEASQIEQRALIALGGLDGDLEQLEAAAVDDDEPAMEAFARRIVSERDALESVRDLLARRGSGGALGRALARFDGRARAAFSAFPAAGAWSDLPWLGEVASNDPDAWWIAWLEE